MMAAINRSGLSKPTILFVKEGDKTHYDSIVESLVKLGEKEEINIQVEPYQNESEVGLKAKEGRIRFDPNSFTLALPQSKVVFILSNGIGVDGNPDQAGVILWDRLMPPFVRKKINDIKQIAEQILEAT